MELAVTAGDSSEQCSWQYFELKAGCFVHPVITLSPALGNSLTPLSLAAQTRQVPQICFGLQGPDFCQKGHQISFGLQGFDGARTTF